MVRAFILWLCVLAAPLWADATYRVTVSFDWQQPELEDPHWSRLIAFAHTPRYSLFADGQTASSGLGLVATNGRVSVLQAELDEGQRRGRVGAREVVPGLEAGRGQFVLELTLTEEHHLVSFATMLAPSPDWFSGASGVDLRNAEGWVDQLTRPLWVWDAGVDSGGAFVSANTPTQPRESVRLLVHDAFLKPTGMAPIGDVRFERLR